MNDKIKQWAYRVVLRDLTKFSIFRGEADGRKELGDFMRGIFATMEYIAYQAEDKEFADGFVNNLKASGIEVSQYEL